jgi:hypothetical protein
MGHIAMLVFVRMRRVMSVLLGHGCRLLLRNTL